VHAMGVWAVAKIELVNVTIGLHSCCWISCWRSSLHGVISALHSGEMLWKHMLWTTFTLRLLFVIHVTYRFIYNFGSIILVC
jgi:hypothetical protein